MSERLFHNNDPTQLDGEGWYYYDLTSGVNGPFQTAKECSEAMEEFLESYYTDKELWDEATSQWDYKEEKRRDPFGGADLRLLSFELEEVYL